MAKVNSGGNGLLKMSLDFPNKDWKSLDWMLRLK